MQLTTAPLAYRLRPRTLEDFVGQETIVGKGTALRKAIEEDRLTSVILAGPPGTGKTTLATIIAEMTNAAFVQLNAVISGVKELRAVCEQAEATHRNLKQRTILFIDEIHRFNRSQQDALLPFVESGTVILIGATTQNPYFDVNSALISRSQVYLLKPLTEEQLFSILQRALMHQEGFNSSVQIADAALKHIAQLSNGDARIALNLLDMTVLTVGEKVSLEKARALLKERSKRYDQKGDDHYDTISAFIKTMRGSDPDAALIWLFKMIESGEEPRFVFRRMSIFASEDIGMADPRALQMVVSAWQAFELVGLPEGEYFLAQACVYLSQATKSNAVKIAMGAAKEIVQKASTLEVPNHLRNAPVKAMRDQGYHVGYAYPHNHPGGVVAANYFPIGMEPKNLYEPSDRGFEEEVKERLQKVRKIIRSKPS
ncbi:MAG: replication-associated recombination protein A [Patescibacteria group bacterium]